jgi:hypothetical protein
MILIISSILVGCGAVEQETEIPKEVVEEVPEDAVIESEEEPESSIDTELADSYVGHYESAEDSTVDIEKKDDSYSIKIFLYRTADITGTILSTEDGKLIFDCKSDYDAPAKVAFYKDEDLFYLDFVESSLDYVETGIWSDFVLGEYVDNSYDTLLDGWYETIMCMDDPDLLSQNEMSYACASKIEFDGDSLNITAAFDYTDSNGEYAYLVTDDWHIQLNEGITYILGGEGEGEVSQDTFVKQFTESGAFFRIIVENGKISLISTGY